MIRLVIVVALFLVLVVRFIAQGGVFGQASQIQSQVDEQQTQLEQVQAENQKMQSTIDSRQSTIDQWNKMTSNS